MKTEEKESEGKGECSAGDEGQERREEKREQTDPSRSPFPRPPRLPVSVLVGTVYTQTEALNTGFRPIHVGRLHPIHMVCPEKSVSSGQLYGPEIKLQKLRYRFLFYSKI